jgi:hypothetical protein
VTFTCEDLEELTRLVMDAWSHGLDRDWSVRAGTLEWSCSRTAAHAVDAVARIRTGPAGRLVTSPQT